MKNGGNCRVGPSGELSRASERRRVRREKQRQRGGEKLRGEKFRFCKVSFAPRVHAGVDRTRGKRTRRERILRCFTYNCALSPLSLSPVSRVSSSTSSARRHLNKTNVFRSFCLSFISSRRLHLLFQSVSSAPTASFLKVRFCALINRSSSPRGSDVSRKWTPSFHSSSSASLYIF